MGTWGFSILENDASADAYGTYVDYMNAKLSPKQALAKIKQEFDETLEDPEDAAYIWLGVAKAQWEYGHIDAAMIKRIAAIAASDAHLSEWDDAGPKGRQKREKVIANFVTKLRTENPKPKKPRNAKLRLPVYQPGTCLSIARDDGQFLAVLVGFTVRENPGPGQDTFGINSLLLLDYLAKQPPTPAVFAKRQFVYEERDKRVSAWTPVARHGFANFHRRSKDKLSIVGQVKLTESDVILPNCITEWHFDDADALLDAWHKNRKRKDLNLGPLLENIPAYQALMKKFDDDYIAEHGREEFEDFAKSHGRTPIEKQLDLSPLAKS